MEVESCREQNAILSLALVTIVPIILVALMVLTGPDRPEPEGLTGESVPIELLVREDSPRLSDGEEDRQAVNEWIRNSGELDALADYEAAVRDPDNPSRLLPAFNPGDNLHPNDEGYAAMVDELDLEEICAS